MGEGVASPWLEEFGAEVDHMAVVFGLEWHEVDVPEEAVMGTAAFIIRW